MNRRDFARSLVGGTLGATAASIAKSGIASAHEAPAPRKKALMHVAHDQADHFTKEDFQYMQRHGVKHFEAEVAKRSEGGKWDFDEMRRMRDLADKNDMILEMVPFRAEKRPWEILNIMLGKSPERDREIEIINENIVKASKVGIPAMRYHWKLFYRYRNGTFVGPGSSVFTTWKLEENWRDLPMTDAGRITMDEYWERMTYCLERILPVAEEYKVRIACHPPDPPLPLGYRGMDHWNYDMFKGLKKYASLVDSPNFGFLLCIGTVAEGLKDPGGDEILDIVRYFGERKKIFWVHLRNIRGGRDHFREAYPDDGDIDFYKVMKVLKEVEYQYGILPDHMPTHPDDPGSNQAFAYGFGYIKAMIQAVNFEA